ncbi:helix-turn-helix domain-containing protein [Clostridium sp. SHJSY1]|uniref:helix-turn-helix domain-containing protein n=1 Tax=Clostridium sp. SHJSY1 TaxID=2942483 RepID=UPI002874E51F|nr:helix-turn-helix transcriptional regulator [Clostridium sp. SHJSY1]MDS0524178.1 helix-turn-helix domain-containing protein [Clostridium sp. SHJSY1]
MELVIGKVISSLRKEKGITQEELAKAVGVSTPAVSKWESGISYPDITLLPIIARYFNISTDKLLDFQKDLTKKEVVKIAKECAERFESIKYSEAMKFSEDYLREYPNNNLLKIRIAHLFFMYLARSQEEKLQDQSLNRAIELSEEASKSSDLEVKQAALVYLSSLYNITGKTKEAIEILESFPKTQYESDIILASIYIKEKEFEKARKIEHKNLYKNINSTLMNLHAMFNLAIEEKNYEFALKLAGKCKNIIQLFDLDNVMLPTNYLVFLEAYTLIKNEELTLKYLEEYVESVRHMEPASKCLANNEYFNTMEAGDKIISEEYLKNSLKLSITLDKKFDFVKDKDRYKECIRKLSKIK